MLNKSMETTKKTGQIEDLKIVLTILGLLVIVAGITVVKTTSGGKSSHSNPNGGSVTLIAEFRGSKIALDQIAEHTTSKDGEAYTATNLENRPYQFAVVKDGYWPWAKTLTPEEKKDVTFDTFSILMSPKREDLNKESEEYVNYRKTFAELKVPGEESKITSKDGTMTVWAEMNSIFASWSGDADKIPSYFCKDGVCASRLNIITIQYNVRSLAFLGEHNNSIIFSDDQGIYALEINQRDNQNFQPIYRTAIPQFIPLDARTLMVESNGNIFKLSY